MKIKAKMNKWDLIKLKSLCPLKEVISKVKGQLSEWEKIIANKTTDKELISKIYKQFMQLNIKKKFHQKMGGRPKQTFLQEDIQIAKKHIKRCSTMFIIREM